VAVLPVLITPPPFWSSRPASSTSRAMFPPRSDAAYAAFVGAAVRRYGPNGSFWRAHPNVPFLPIHSWQVWNEPNIPNFWRSGVNAHEYVKLLKAASGAIRAADPHAEVVAAGLPNSNLGVPFLTYLDRMYKAGAKGLFDTLAIHPYSHDVQGLLTLAEHARVLMDRWHDRSRLWITEFGWSTGGDASAFRVSELGQANRIAEALSGLVAQRRALRLRGFVLFKWKDSLAPPAMGGDPWPLHTGLLDAYGAPKRGYWVFGRAVGALRATAAQPAATAGSPTLAEVSRRTVRLSPLGYAAVTLGCRSEETDACGGRLRLESARRVRCGDQRVAAGAELGEAPFRVPVAPAIAPVRLSSDARRLAECEGRIRVRASVARWDSKVASASGTRAVEFEIRAR
jgi:Glycosyl hydrolase catalytic core